MKANDSDPREDGAGIRADRHADARSGSPTPSTLWLMDEDPDPAPADGSREQATLFEDGAVRSALMDMSHALGAEPGDLGGPADPNSVRAPGADDSEASSLRLCALADTLSRSRG
jgi:hypothetical protein